MRALVLALALTFPKPALAAAAAEVVAGPEDRSLPWLGVALDAGVPSGLGASAQVRPLPWLRLHAGGGTNGAAAGVHGGATFAVPWAVAPTLTLEGGRFFEGDANQVVRLVGQAPALGERMLERVRYDWASAQLGLELGSQRSFAFFLRGGASYVDGSLGTLGGELDGEVTFEASQPRLRGTIPSAKLGFVLWIG